MEILSLEELLWSQKDKFKVKSYKFQTTGYHTVDETASIMSIKAIIFYFLDSFILKLQTTFKTRREKMNLAIIYELRAAWCKRRRHWAL